MPSGVYIRTKFHKTRIKQGWSKNKGKNMPQMIRKNGSSHFGRYAKKGYIKERNTSGLRPHKKGEYRPTKETIEKQRKKVLGRPSKLKGIPRLKHRGANASNWKGGITEQQKLERGWFKRYIQQKVFERDDYTCRICEERGGDLQVDHIQSWKDYPELRFDISNCRTVCKKCHYRITFNKPMDIDRPWGHNFKYYQKGLG